MLSASQKKEMRSSATLLRKWALRGVQQNIGESQSDEERRQWEEVRKKVNKAAQFIRQFCQGGRS